MMAKKIGNPVAVWLLIGVAMIVVQVLIGGITRLTESGLSITEWKPITGTLPPLNESAWHMEFAKYRNTDQFRYVHQHFSLQDFKYIFFWEWFHRLWARLLGVVFLTGFIYFLVRRKFNRNMTFPLLLLFSLGALQGAVGWLMVKSGLVAEKYYVGHVELTTHLIAALLLLAYTLWFAYNQVPAMQLKIYNNTINNIIKCLGILLLVQLIFGGLMAGLKAAQIAPTWPDINGDLIPPSINELKPGWQNLVNNPIAIHFIHRGIGYLLVIFTIYFFLRSRNITGNKIFNYTRLVFSITILMQVFLGILTVLNSTDKSIFVWFGVAHQFTAMLLVICMITLLYISKKESRKIITGDP